MIAKLTHKMREEKGFTLIELMVVVLIIGILIAIALPTFLGARARAQRKAATSDLRNAIAAAKTCYTDHDTYDWAGGANTDCGRVTLAPIEPSLSFVDPGVNSDAANTYAVSVGFGNVVGTDGQKWGAARLAAEGTCFYIVDYGVDPGTGAGTFRTSTPAAATCNANTALGVTASDGSW